MNRIMGGTDTKTEERTLHIDFDRNGILRSYGFDSTDRSGVS